MAGAPRAAGRASPGLTGFVDRLAVEASSHDSGRRIRDSSGVSKRAEGPVLAKRSPRGKRKAFAVSGLAFLGDVLSRNVQAGHGPERRDRFLPPLSSAINRGHA